MPITYKKSAPRRFNKDVKLPGLFSERMRSGNLRWRVRPMTNAKRKITLPCGPDDPDFYRLYDLARSGYIGRHSAIEGLKATGNLSAHITAMLGRARARAEKNHWDFNLTPKGISEMLRAQECRCAVSGVRFDLAPIDTGGRRPMCPSIDRIDNRAGYVLGNIRLTTTIVNIAMSDWADADFFAMCEAVARERER
jgi:hypothetical protein